MAIEVTAETVKTAVWQVIKGETQVVSLGEIKDWDGKEETSLVTAVDESLAMALETIEPEPNQAVLGLPDGWVTGALINEEGKKLLRAVADKLELKFIGFVVVSEAIIHELRHQEGAPVTAILLTLTETEVGVQVVHLGKILGAELVGRGEDLSLDVEEGLARMKLTEALPARMILTNGHLDLEAARQTLLSYNWKERLSFLHVPKIDILERDFSIRAVANAGGTEAAKALGWEVSEDMKEEANQQTDTKQLAAAPGFVREKDVTDEELPAEAVVEEEAVMEPVAAKPHRLREMGRRWGEKITGWRLPEISWGRPKMALMIGGGVASLSGLVILGIMYWNLPRAKVTVYVNAEILEREVELVADPQATRVDEEKKIIPAREEGIEVDGAEEQSTTGEALVGDKAKGTVTMYNRTTQIKTWTPGTVLTGPKNLKFTLDQEVTVASESSSTGTWGAAEGRVTAAQIGTESNLAANTEFSVANFSASAYSARNATDFGGGTARTARVVAKEDQQQLVTNLKQKLENEAKEKLISSLNQGERWLETVVKEEVVKQQFSRAVGEEADKVSLAMKLKLTMFRVREADFDQLLAQQIQGAVPANFRTDPAGTSLTIKEAVSQESGRIKLNSLAKITLIPEINLTEVRNKIKGKYPQTVRNYFESVVNYAGMEIALTPKLPKRLATLPHRADHIEVEVKVK